MKTLRLSPAAEADLASIWRYSAEQWNIAQADRYLGEINDAFVQLANGERNGRSIQHVRAGFLKFSVGSHFIVYRQTRNAIDVVRVLHQRMDLEIQLQR